MTAVTDPAPEPRDVAADYLATLKGAEFDKFMEGVRAGTATGVSAGRDLYKGTRKASSDDNTDDDHPAGMKAGRDLFNRGTKR